MRHDVRLANRAVTNAARHTTAGLKFKRDVVCAVDAFDDANIPNQAHALGVQVLALLPCSPYSPLLYAACPTLSNRADPTLPYPTLPCPYPALPYPALPYGTRPCPSLPYPRSPTCTRPCSQPLVQTDRPSVLLAPTSQPPQVGWRICVCVCVRVCVCVCVYSVLLAPTSRPPQVGWRLLRMDNVAMTTAQAIRQM